MGLCYLLIVGFVGFAGRRMLLGDTLRHGVRFSWIQVGLDKEE